MGNGKERLARWTMFVFSSLTSFSLDLVCFNVLYDHVIGEGGTGRLFYSVVGARTVSLVYNFLVNRCLVFKAGNGVSRLCGHFVKYLMLAASIMFCSYLLTNLAVLLVQTRKVVYVKVTVDFFLFVVSYVMQHRLVFKRVRSVVGVCSDFSSD